ncbi:MAG: right-handed parallel beta-helix repeat-containing protein, partial [Ilumatobacter fluminis]
LGNGDGGVLVESSSNTVGTSGKKNVISFNGTLVTPPDIEPGATSADVAPTAPLEANVVVAPNGGGTISGNDLGGGGAGVFVDTATDTSALSITDNTIDAELGIVTWPSSTRGSITVSGNTITGTSPTESLGVLVSGDLSDSDTVAISGNTITDVGAGVVALAATSTKRVSVDGNEVTAEIGVLGLGSSNLGVSGNTLTATLGVLAVSEADGGRDYSNSITGNTFDGHAAVMVVGSEGDTISGNTMPDVALGVMAVATRGVDISGNDISGDVGIWTLNPISNTYGGDSITGNDIESDIGVVAAERAAVVQNNDLSGFDSFGIFSSPAMAATVRGNDLAGDDADVGMLLFDTGGADISANTVTGATIGVLGGGDDTPQGSGTDGESVPAPASMWESLIENGEGSDEVSDWASSSQTAIGFSPSDLYQLSTDSTATDWRGNTITGNGAGLVLVGNADGNLVEDNEIRDNATAGLALVGSPGPQDVTIRNNVLSGNATSAPPGIDYPAGLPDNAFVNGSTSSPGVVPNDHGDADVGP